MVFANRELLIMRDCFEWRRLIQLPAAIVRNEQDYLQMFEALRLSVLANHAEIMRQALKEHIDFVDNVHVEGALDGLGFFLFDFRNAFSHTRDTLIPRWSEKTKTKGVFSCAIPIAKQADGIKFVTKGSASMKFVMKVTPGKVIRVTGDLINSIILLSYHVLELVKKQKPHTLERYLKNIPTAS